MKKNNFNIEYFSFGGTQVNLSTFAGQNLIADIKEWDKDRMIAVGKEEHISPELTPLRKIEYDMLTDFTNNLS